ncbi:MAG: flagellar hook capping FlgD N-terminal domain-containing protein [Phycisphaerales bacterium]
MDAIGSVGGGATLASVDKGYSSLDSDQWTRIILEELGNQDPLEPNDTGALLDQLSTIRSLESDTELNETLSRLVDRSEFTTAAGLIGNRVTTVDDGALAREVVSVSQSADGVTVTLDNGRSVPLSSIATVSGPGVSS